MRGRERRRRRAIALVAKPDIASAAPVVPSGRTAGRAAPIAFPSSRPVDRATVAVDLAAFAVDLAAVAVDRAAVAALPPAFTAGARAALSTPRVVSAVAPLTFLATPPTASVKPPRPRLPVVCFRVLTLALRRAFERPLALVERRFEPVLERPRPFDFELPFELAFEVPRGEAPLDFAEPRDDEPPRDFGVELLADALSLPAWRRRACPVPWAIVSSLPRLLPEAGPGYTSPRSFGPAAEPD